MKAAIIRQYGKPDVLQIKEIPDPVPRSGRILVEVHAASLNPKDILVRKGKFKVFTGNRFPMILSSDYAGVILDPGKSASLMAGDRVFGMMNGFKVGSTAEKVLVKETELAKLPEGIGFQEVAGVPLAGLTALQAIRDLGKLKAQQTICINGASGGVGSLAIQISKCLGAKVISVSSERNLSFCKALGADEVIDYAQENWLKNLLEVDLFFDVFGNYALKNVSSHLTPKGKYISTLPRIHTIKNHIFTRFSAKKGRLVVVKSKAKDLQWLANQMANGNIKPVVDSIFPLEDIQKAHERVETKRARGKVLIKLK